MPIQVHLSSLEPGKLEIGQENDLFLLILEAWF